MATGNLESALRTFSDLNSHFGGDDLPAIRELVAMALATNGIVCAQMDRNEEAIAAWDQVVVRYGDEGAQFDAAVACALGCKATLLAQIGEAELALAELADLDRRFGDNTEPEIRAVVAPAIAHKAALEVLLHRPEAALASVDRLVGEFAASVDPKELQWAEWTRAKALLIQGEHELALKALAAAYSKTTIDEDTPRRLLHHVPELIDCGLAAHELLSILTADSRKSTAMSPIVTMLRLCNGEMVRVPSEVLAVAQDMAKYLDESIARVRARGASIAS